MIPVNVRILTFLVSSIFLSVPVAAAEWHGLIPGRSTRQDVNRVLGECQSSTRQCEFNLTDEDVFITFSASDTCTSRDEGLVLLIQRDFLADVSFASLNLNYIRFKKFDPSWPHGIGYQGFINEEMGLAVKTFDKRIIQVAYFPGAKERQFCRAYYAKPREFVDAPVEHAPNLFVKCPKGPCRPGSGWPSRLNTFADSQSY